MTTSTDPLSCDSGSETSPARGRTASRGALDGDAMSGRSPAPRPGQVSLSPAAHEADRETTADGSATAGAQPRPRGPHPGLLMLAFFLVLIGFNVAFFTLAATQPPDVVTPDDPRVRHLYDALNDPQIETRGGAGELRSRPTWPAASTDEPPAAP